MVRLQLMIRADLENVTDFQPADSETFGWVFNLKCGSCQETHPKSISMNRSEEREITRGKGSTANFVWRCGNCKRESSAKFEQTPPWVYTVDDSLCNAFAPLVVIDCRGLEFVGFDPQGIWKCTGVESGTQFTEIDLMDGEWTDYDEKAKQPVGIMNIESKWIRAP